MKILLLTKKVPFPLTDGEVIAIHNLSKGLVDQGCEIHLLALNTQKHYVSFDEIPVELQHFRSIEIIDIDTRIQLFPALKCFLGRKSYNIQRFVSEAFDRALKKKLDEIDFDIVQLETLYLAPYIKSIRAVSAAKIALRSHNVESTIWENLSERESGLKGWYLKHCASMLALYEAQTQNTYDLLVPITKLDSEQFESRGEQAMIKVISVGLNMDNYLPQITSHTVRKIGFLGSLDWQPNLEGLDWFLEIWPELFNINPQLEFHIGGRNIPIRLAQLATPGVVIHNKVDNAIKYMKEMDVFLVPLFSGSGIRVKILEAMALGKLVLSTPKGFEGIGVKDKNNALVFENETELIYKMNHIEEVDVASLCAAARSHIESHFSAEATARDLMRFYKNNIN